MQDSMKKMGHGQEYAEIVRKIDGIVGEYRNEKEHRAHSTLFTV